MFSDAPSQAEREEDNTLLGQSLFFPSIVTPRPNKSPSRAADLIWDSASSEPLLIDEGFPQESPSNAVEHLDPSSWLMGTIVWHSRIPRLLTSHDFGVAGGADGVIDGSARAQFTMTHSN